MTRMRRMMMWVLFAFLLCLPLTAKAQIIGAVTCSSTDVQTALNKVVAVGTTVSIPPGTCTWTSPIKFNAPANFTLLGSGSQSTVGGGDVTILIDNLNRSVLGDVAMLDITTPQGTFRISALTIQGSGQSAAHTYVGSLRLRGASQQVRVDHVHFNRIDALAFSTYNNVSGVFDHDIVDGTSGSGWRTYGNNSGDDAWAANTALGSGQFLFFEDNIFNNASNDCNDGGRWVIRHNTFNAATGQSNQVLTHPTGGGSGRDRGCRAWEVYQNTFINNTGSSLYNIYFLSAGTGVIWGNTSTPKGWQAFMSLHSMRRSNSTYTQTATPNGWGYCGTSFNGAGSAWDQNLSASTGYACLDQPGRGKGDLLNGSFPNVMNTTTGSITWPHQALEPIYEWQDSWTGTWGGPFLLDGNSDVLVQNQDFYLANPSFNGTSGVGSGLLSARPSTCTPNVAYWATDQNTLYQCSAANTWTAYYTAYIYPHPLVTSSGIPPAPPTGLAAIVN